MVAAAATVATGFVGGVVSLFLARISRGRTLRQFVIGVLLIPFSFILMWVSIFGNSAIEVVRGGSRYRDKSEETKLTTATDGSVTVPFSQAGLYWFGAETQDDKSSIPGARRRAVYNATFEVLPQ